MGDELKARLLDNLNDLHRQAAALPDYGVQFEIKQILTGIIECQIVIANDH